jgi:glycosyltransferase involved in cell wall biosynthesis
MLPNDSNWKNLAIIILAFNEEKHIARCINSIKDISKEVYVIDSFSTDSTVEISKSLGAYVLQNEFINQAKQMNWALNNCNIRSKWIMRLDADEYVLPELALEISSKLCTLEDSISGIYLKRRVYFLNKWIKYGGIYPIYFLRIFRNGHALSEDRWMDEHIKLIKGRSISFENDFVDENLNSISWWIQRQNNYANREMIVMVLDKYCTEGRNLLNSRFFGKVDERKRWFKNIYNVFPRFIRPFFLFFYNYVLRGGFRSGYPGLIRFFYLSLWYRFLVDSKLYELELRSKKNYDKMKEIIKVELGYEI